MHIVAALARGSEPHRLLYGDGPQGPWCGVGETHPALGATARAVLVGLAAAALDGSHHTRDEGTEDVAFDTAPRDVGNALEQARTRLVALDPASTARSWIVAIEARPSAVEAWLALGPPACSVLVRCWPGIIQGPDAAGEDGSPAPLALANDAFSKAVATGRVPARRAAAALAAAQGTTIAEGFLAERQARLMEDAGDDRGAAVRRLVAQAYAVDIALAAFREVTASGP